MDLEFGNCLACRFSETRRPSWDALDQSPYLVCRRFPPQRYGVSSSVTSGGRVTSSSRSGQPIVGNEDGCFEFQPITQR